MHVNNDDLLRDAPAADEAGPEGGRTWRRAVRRALGDTHSARGVNAQPAGPANPNRRRFLAVGGATVASAAVLAACSSSTSGGVAHTGDQPSTTSTEVPPQAPAASEALTEQEADQSTLQTATSLELLLVSFYDEVKDNAYIKDGAALAALQLFRHHHDQHADALKTATQNAGAKPYDKPNKVLQTTLIDPTVAKLTDPAAKTADVDWITFCKKLEDVATATYVAAASSLGTAELRQTAMSIGAVDARHQIILANLISPNDPSGWIDGSEQSITDAIGSDAAIGASS